MKRRWRGLWSALSNPHKAPRAQQKPRFRHVVHYERVLGTSLELHVVSAREAAGPEAERATLDEIDRLEAIFNAYNPRSELAQWQSTHERAVPVSPELAHVLARAEHWRIATHGAFNPASEALTRLWTEQSARDQRPTSEQLSALLGAMNQPLWTVQGASTEDACPPLLPLTATRHTALPVTLNAIAKGYIIDCAAQIASQVDGVRQVLVNIGGDLRHVGSAPVKAAIAHPRDDAENALPADTVCLCNQGLATSGDYRRGFQIGGQHFSHVLDPRTGQPAQGAPSVSVLAASSMDADALSTAFSVLSPPQSLDLANSLHEVGILVITETDERYSNTFWDAHSLKNAPAQEES